MYVGIPIMEYIRRRRLAYAAAELARDKRIIDIALDYGFETHNGFAKAFRRVYGCSPEAYRLHVSGHLPKKVDLMLLEQFNLSGGIVVEPKIVTKPTVKVAGYELHTTCRDGKNLQDITAFWQSLIPDKLTRLHSTLPAVQPNEYGICFPPDSATGDFSYVVALEVPDYRACPVRHVAVARFPKPPMPSSPFPPWKRLARPSLRPSRERGATSSRPGSRIPATNRPKASWSMNSITPAPRPKSTSP